MIKNYPDLMRSLLPIIALVLSVFGLARGQNPEGVWEGEIQDPKRPTVINVDFKTRRVSFSGAAPTTITQPALPSDDNRVRFQVVSGAQTLKFAARQDGTRITGEMDTGSRTIPFYLELLPSLPKPAGRAAAWQQDIDVVISRFLRYDRSFTAARREATRARLEALRAKVDRMSDQAITVELARAVALSGNAHTRLYLMRNRTEVRRVPIRVWWFGNELRVLRAVTENADLSGCRITAIGRRDVLTAFRTVQDIKAGNSSWQRYMSTYFLTSPDILFGAGVLPNPNRLPLTVNCDGKVHRVELTPLPLRRSSAPVEAWWDLAPAYPHVDGLKPALAVEKAPLYLRHPDRNYWVEYLDAPAIVYLQYNRAQEMSSEPMADFIRRVTRIFDEHSVKGLIVDVRFNTGGDAGVGTPLVETLAARLKGLPVVVLTGRATFSAGITHAAQWKQFANASIIGEPAGDGLDLWSEGGNLLLPNSGLTVHYANGFHAYSQIDYPAFKPYFADLNVASLAPDKQAETTWVDYFAGRDPVLDAALARIRKSK
jgi:hypothetical protein